MRRKYSTAFRIEKVMEKCQHFHMLSRVSEPDFLPCGLQFFFCQYFLIYLSCDHNFFSSVHNINGTYKILTIKISESGLSKQLMSWGQIQHIRKIAKRQKWSPQDKKSGSETLLKCENSAISP